MTIEDFLGRLANPKRTGQGWQAKCPCHEDHKQSLSVSPGDKGIVLKCHAGCETADILKSVGVSMKDLFKESLAKPHSRPLPAPKKVVPAPKPPAAAAAPAVPAPKSKIVAEYDYKDEKGVLLFQVVRFDPKDFRQRAPGARGGWDWRTANIRKVLFRLPELAAALKADPEKPVFVCEGEKDVLALVKAGAVATCNPGGAGKWKLEYGAALEAARKVIIVADKDAPGRKHAQVVAASLSAGSRLVKLIEVPGAQNKDVADFLKDGGTVDQLIKVADGAIALQNPVPPGAQPGQVPAELPPCVFDLARQRWFIPSPGAREWIPINDTRVAVYLKSHGFAEYMKDTFGISVLERAMHQIVTEKNVHFAGQVSGFKPGLTEICGKRVLITTGPHLPEPKPGDWPTFLKMLEQMLMDPEQKSTQWDLFCGWIKAAYEALRDGANRPGLVLVLCGKAGSGKSFLQTLITRILGGRSANPYPYMTGRTDFNLDLIGAEHMAIDDESSERDIKSRNSFGQHCKKMAVGHTVTLHGKGRDAISVERFTRISICLNDDPHDLMVLPPMEDSIREKFLILRIHPATFPDMQRPDDFAQFKAKIYQELPMFLHYLTKVFSVPPALRSARYGVGNWQHPGLFMDLEDLHPWRRLMELIDHVRPWEVEPCGQGLWSGTVGDLEELLRSKAPGRSGILRGAQGTGMDLGSAHQRMPDRVGKRQTKSMGHTIWMIKKPAGEEATLPVPETGRLALQEAAE